ncbi:sugar ABC transporter ATP-binding protein [Hoeflea sp. Naph1]|uniref:sugar ABC transporter ATP-binding protein n=1 Tax=Hoeflea sp. Naph1 TaxID=3388653 RepID=UPI00398FBADF
MVFLDVNGLSKRFGGIVALDNASFSGAQGEVHALLGENGAGKSTFIQILSGALRPDSGTISLGGAAFTAATPDMAASAGIAAVFQELSVIPDLTVEQNIWFRREPRKFGGMVDRREMRRRSEALLTAYNFPPLDLDADLRSLNLAEQQITEIAKGLSKNTRVIILDEATSALPATEAQWLLKTSRKLAEEGRLVIFISHRMSEVRFVADRLTIFRNGETVGTHRIDAVSDDDIVTQMIGRRLASLYPHRTPSETGRIALRVDCMHSRQGLKNVSFALSEGEVLGVGGLQGHGQRELFQSIFGASSAEGGVELWGRPANIGSPRDALTGTDGIALVPEDRKGQGLLLDKSVAQNLTLSILPLLSRSGLVDRTRESSAVDQMIEKLSIKVGSRAQTVGTLSGGNQQKVVIGKMLLTGAKVLLLYDPTRGVDVGTKAEIFRLMRELAAQGYAILFYSSDLSELVNVADRVIVMRDGETVDTIATPDLTEEAILSAAVLDTRGH